MIRYSKFSGSELEVSALVSCYRDVFSTSPWYEWKKCSVCGEYWGAENYDVLASILFMHCGTPVQDFWPEEVVRADIAHEMGALTSCHLAWDSQKLIGFCWGYLVNQEELRKKLDLELPSTTVMIAYQDEVGVLADYRGRGIAKELVRRRAVDFESMGVEYCFVRTRLYPERTVTFDWYTNKLGFEIVAWYGNDDGRVVLGGRLAEMLALLS